MTTISVSKETHDKLLKLRSILDPFLTYPLSFSELLEYMSSRFLSDFEDDVKLLSFIDYIAKKREAMVHGGKHTETDSRV